MSERISVIIPSALRATPDGELWLAKALRSVAAQTLLPHDVWIGLDPDAVPQPVGEFKEFPLYREHGKIKGHQAACNAAVQASTGSLLAIIEDDDVWLPWHLATLYGTMERNSVGFVSTSQQQVTFDGEDKGVFDFPTCSGWLMRRDVWNTIKGFDESYTIHHDNEWLGRLNRDGIRRVHLVEATANPPQRQQLTVLPLFSWIMPGSVEGLSVKRMLHAESIMAGVASDDVKKRRSELEYQSLVAEYGLVPW